MRPYLRPCINSCQIWCVRVFHHVLLKYDSHANDEMQKKKKKKKWCHTSVLYITFSYINKVSENLEFNPLVYLFIQVNASYVTDHLETLIRPSIDYISEKRFPSGNFLSSLGNQTDRLIHWCHGSPGAIYMLLQAYKVSITITCTYRYNCSTLFEDLTKL